MQSRPDKTTKKEPSEFLDAMRKGALIGLGVLALVLPGMWFAKQPATVITTKPPAVAQQQPAPVPAPATPEAPPAAEAAPPQAAPQVRLASFGDEQPSPDAKLVANWAAHTGDHKKHAFIIIDKKQARAYVFDPQAQLKSSAPVLLGKAVGDDYAPDIGTRPLSKVKEHEKTTPAGRFVAEPGVNSHGEDIVWVSYDLAVSMHRIRKVKEAERRFERLATPTVADNRISFGCINMPVAFYNSVLSPTVKKYGAVVYVLPDVKSVQQVFRAYDVTQPAQIAQVSATPRQQ